MSITNPVLQKITDILLWNGSIASQLIVTVDVKNSIIVSENFENIRTQQYATIIVENRCGIDGFQEIKKIVSALDWNEVFTFILVTDSAAHLGKIENKILSLVKGQSDLYGVDPDYYFSLVPIKGAHHRKVQNFILSLKSSATLKEKVKKIIKKVLVVFGRSSLLYEHYVYCFYRVK